MLQNDVSIMRMIVLEMERNQDLGNDNPTIYDKLNVRMEKMGGRNQKKSVRFVAWVLE